MFDCSTHYYTVVYTYLSEYICAFVHSNTDICVCVCVCMGDVYHQYINIIFVLHFLTDVSISRVLQWQFLFTQ